MRTSTILTVLILLASAGLLFGVFTLPFALPRWFLWILFVGSLVVTINSLSGKPIPFLRWSFLRMLFGMKTLVTKWQVGDGREQRVANTVVKIARKGDAADVIRVIDDFGYNDALLINVGDRKGGILDQALVRARPKKILELGTYVGYSAIRMAQKLEAGGHLYSVEFSSDNAAIARRIIEHAGLSDRITIVVGTLGDGGKTADVLEREHGFADGTVDFVFIDHAKDAYLPDLSLIVSRGWLHPASVVVADNIKFPGAPEYHAHMVEQEGKSWRTTAHKSFVEYQSMIPDLVLESVYLG